MFSLARANIGHQWKLFLAAISVLVLSGCLIYVSIGISLSNLRTITAYERSLNVDLYLSVKSQNRRTPIPNSVLNIVSDLGFIETAEPVMFSSEIAMLEIEGQITRMGIQPLDLANNSILIPRQFDETARAILREIGNVVILETLAEEYNLKINDVIRDSQSGLSLRIAGIYSGEITRSRYTRQFGLVFMSQETNSLMGLSVPRMRIPRYFYIALNIGDARAIDDAKTILNGILKAQKVQAQSPEDLIFSRTIDAFLKDKEIQGFLTVGLFAVFISLIIVVQTLRSAILTQSPQFATMRALGVPTRYLVSIAMEQALWVGLLSAALSYCVMLIIKWPLFQRDIFIFVPLNIILLVSAAIIGAALLAGLISLFAIFKTQPQELLR